MDLSEVFPAQIRALQAMYPEAHQTLVNWAKWSRDRHKVYPPGVTPNPMWESFDSSKVTDWGEEHAIPKERLAQADTKSEPHEKEDYDEKAGREIDERIHGYGGLSVTIRDTLRVAYVSRYLPESQFPKAAGCSHDAFRERLEAALVFVSRFA